MRIPRDLHPVAWWVWALGLAVGTSFTTNPFLLALLLGAITLSVLTCRSDQPWARSFRLYVWLGVVLVVIRIVFRVLLGGDVPGHVLFTLPSVPLPDWVAGIDLLGPFTREEPARRDLRGTAPLDPGHRGRRRQRAGQPQAADEVAAARPLRDRHGDDGRHQRAAAGSPTAPPGCGPRSSLRGGAEGRVRGLRRVLVPVLEDAFERSLALAAGMDARGYGRSGAATPAQRRTTGGLMVAGLLGVVVGVYAFLDASAPRLLALPMLLLGTVVALAGFVSAGRRVERTRYRPDRWRPAEIAVALSGLATGAGLWAVQRWEPDVAYPGVAGVPAISPLALVAVLVAVLPVWVAPPPLTAHSREHSREAVSAP
ncbi:energy-coupling factor transporter transmembrane protein EcfT [Nocardioides convexus]|uniref:energy-coupling factor transporter transmembrane protein EcfT n=1 Tax=Nocardioides convexus TaxID=2712224 RepID=UPI002418633E|nr:energy-coupling factor transporter transmembrane protein EcfT [Nocardioides convexus]